VVVPRLIAQSAMDGLAAIMLYDLVEAMRQRGFDPLTHFGVPVDLSRLDPTEQVRSALVGFEPAYRYLHQQIQSVPALQAQVRLTRVRPRPEETAHREDRTPEPHPSDPRRTASSGAPIGPSYPIPAGGHAPPPGYGEPPSHPSAPDDARTIDPYDSLGIIGGGASVLGSIFGASPSPRSSHVDSSTSAAEAASSRSASADAPLERLPSRDGEIDRPRAPVTEDEVALSALPLDDEPAMTPTADRTKNGIG